MRDISLSFEVEASASNHLAWMNAILGLQRTLMAAERTAVTLIVFGFTMAQVFDNMKSVVPPKWVTLGPNLPRDVGMAMIAAGVGSLALFTWQYLRAVDYLAAKPFAAIALRLGTGVHQLTCFTAYAIMLLGALGFASILVSF
jgi:putative membrane protein